MGLVVGPIIPCRISLFATLGIWRAAQWFYDFVVVIREVAVIMFPLFGPIAHCENQLWLCLWLRRPSVIPCIPLPSVSLLLA